MKQSFFFFTSVLVFMAALSLNVVGAVPKKPLKQSASQSQKAVADPNAEDPDIKLDIDNNVLSIPRHLLTPQVPLQAKAVKLDARSFQALVTAYHALQNDVNIRADKRPLSKYLAVFTYEDKDNYYFYFEPHEKLTPITPNRGGFDDKQIFGQDVRYQVRKSDFTVVHANYYEF